MNVDIEIYLNQLTSYFEKNKQDLVAMISDLSKKETFYKKIKEKAYQNLEKGEEIILTKNQFYEIIQELNDDVVKNSPFIHTNLGLLCLN